MKTRTGRKSAMTELVSVRADDLRLLMEAAPHLDLPLEPAVVPLNEALARCGEALADVKDSSEGGSGPAPEPSLPPGVYARVELPGYRQHTGWVTEEPRFGAQCAVVRDWDGRECAAVVIGPGSQVVYLPTPLRRPEPLTALPAGECVCGPLGSSDGEDIDERPDCPVHDWAYDEGGEAY